MPPQASPLPLYLQFSACSVQASLGAQLYRIRLPMQETWVQSLGQEDPLEKEMATHSSILAWRIPWTEEPCGLQPTRSQRVWHNWATNTFTYSAHLPSSCWPKTKKHSLKAEDYALFGALAEDLRPKSSLSDSLEALLQRGRGGVRIYRSFCNRNWVLGTLKDYC